MQRLAWLLLLLAACGGDSNSPAPRLTALVLSPPSVSLATQATQAFTVAGQMSDGSTGSVAVTFAATGGSITGAGAYTAGATAGTYRVIATQQGGALADTSTVTITPPAPPVYQVIGRVSDSVTGGTPDSVALTMAGQPVAVASDGSFIASVPSGSAVSLSIPGYLPLTGTLTLTGPVTLPLRPTRVRPAVVSQLVAADLLTVAIYDAQGWNTVAFGGAAGTTVALVGPSGFAGLVSGSWLTSMASATTVIASFSFQNPFTTATWDVRDLDGNVARFVCTAGTCAEQ